MARDREQAIQALITVHQGVRTYYSNPEHSFDGSEEDWLRMEAERSIDAYVALPDPVLEAKDRELRELREELYGDEGIRSGRVAHGAAPAAQTLRPPASPRWDRHLNDAIRIQARRAEKDEIERLRAIEEAAQRAFDAYLGVRDQERGDEWTEVDAAMVVLRNARAALVSGESEPSPRLSVSGHPVRERATGPGHRVPKCEPSSPRITDEMVKRAHDAYWDAEPPFTAAGPKGAMRAALEAALDPSPQ